MAYDRSKDHRNGDDGGVLSQNIREERMAKMPAFFAISLPATLLGPLITFRTAQDIKVAVASPAAKPGKLSQKSIQLMEGSYSPTSVQRGAGSRVTARSPAEP